MSRPNEKTLIVGLDIGTSRVSAVVGEYAPGQAVEVIGLGSNLLVRDGEAMSEAALASLLTERGFDDFLVQPYFQQHPVMAGLNAGSVNTLRVVTLATDGEVDLVGALLRVGGGKGDTDNWSGGGRIANVLLIESGYQFDDGWAYGRIGRIVLCRPAVDAGARGRGPRRPPRRPGPLDPGAGAPGDGRWLAVSDTNGAVRYVFLDVALDLTPGARTPEVSVRVSGRRAGPEAVLPPLPKDAEAIAAVPDEMIDAVALVGSKARIKDRLQAWKEAGRRGEVGAAIDESDVSFRRVLESPGFIMATIRPPKLGVCLQRHEAR